MQLQSIAHGVLLLEKVPRDYGRTRRRVQIAKMRGSVYREGYHDYTIVTGGVEVYPRLVASEHLEETPRGVSPSGLPHLDQLWGGGLERGTSTLLLGPAGAGKSSIALSYAIAAARAGDFVSMFLFEELTQMACKRGAGLNLDPRPWIESGRLHMEQIDPAELSPGEFIQHVRDTVEKQGARVVVIDSLNGFMNAMPDEAHLPLQMHELLGFLNHRGVLTILVLSQAGVMGANMTSGVDLSFLVDYVMHFRFFEGMGRVRKAFSVLKKRSGPHVDTIRELTMANGCITIGKPLPGSAESYRAYPATWGPRGRCRTAMPSEHSGFDSNRVLIHAPFGRDNTLIRRELEAVGFSIVISRSVEDLCEAIREGAGAALVGDEALDPKAIGRLSAQLADQPPWSNFPLLVMTSGGAATNASRYRLRLLEPLGNVTLLERPLRAVTLVSSVRAALRDRRRQYQLRGLLAALAASNEELRAANDDLTRVNRELEEFAYVASHDLQEPLRMVNIYTHLILKATEQGSINEGFGDGGEDAKLSQYREFVRQGIDRMEALIRDLLTFSRTIQNNDPAIGVADLSESLNEALSVLRDRIEESGAIITAESLPCVRMDPGQMAHVFQNLLSNSIKYCSTGVTPEIHISAEARDGNWIIAVRDNGIGFDQRYAERIFGLFKRLHKDEYPGTGLGLAICQRIVERYGGRIWAKSAAGLGATFYFALPCVEVG